MMPRLSIRTVCVLLIITVSLTVPLQAESTLRGARSRSNNRRAFRQLQKDKSDVSKDGGGSNKANNGANKGGGNSLEEEEEESYVSSGSWYDTESWDEDADNNKTDKNKGSAKAASTSTANKQSTTGANKQASSADGADSKVSEPDTYDEVSGDDGKAAAKKARGRAYTEYNYFVEACQEELVADVINGGIIQHSQYSGFIYGYCRFSDQEGPNCNKAQEEKGFDYLPNDLKLLYIKSFCPKDVDGQVACLHGVNERGRDYEEGEDEVEKLCYDLEKSMLRNELLVEAKEGKKDNDEDGGDLNVVSPNADLTQAAQDVFDNQNNDNEGEEEEEETPKPTRRPTPRPTPQPTPIQTPKPDVSPRPGPWGSTQSIYAPGVADSVAVDGPAATLPPVTTPRPTNPPTTLPPQNRNPPLEVLNVVTDQNADGEGGGMNTGVIIAIVLIILLGIVIASTGGLLLKKRRLQAQRHNRMNLRQHVFYLTTKLFHSVGFGSNSKQKQSKDKTKHRPLEEDDDDEDSHTKDETYTEDYTGSLLSGEAPNSNGTLGSSGEIDFHHNGALFRTWPVTRKDDFDRPYQTSDSDENDDTDSDDDEEQLPKGEAESLMGAFSSHLASVSDGTGSMWESFGFSQRSSSHTPSDRSSDPSTYQSSLLNSFFSGSAKQSKTSRNSNDLEEQAPLENGVEEIQRAINNAQWKDVYYLASKMASEGNIESGKNLNMALARRNVSRNRLSPEDAQKAAQLDVSLEAGDWITLAARAAVFAALDAADNPVPSSITFMPGQETAEECLAKARVALEEAEQTAKKRQELEQMRQRQQQQAAEEELVEISNEEEEEEYEEVGYVEEKLILVSADESTYLEEEVIDDDEDEDNDESDDDDNQDIDDEEDTINSEAEAEVEARSTSEYSKVSKVSVREIQSLQKGPLSPSQRTPSLEGDSDSEWPETPSTVTVPTLDSPPRAGTQRRNEPNDSSPSSLTYDSAPDMQQDSHEADSETNESRTPDLPGPPTIALSNQSTIPTETSSSPQKPGRSNDNVRFATIEESANVPFIRDFENGISHPMQQDDDTEMSSRCDGTIAAPPQTMEEGSI